MESSIGESDMGKISQKYKALSLVIRALSVRQAR